jgi:hypothetical protein
VPIREYNLEVVTLQPKVQFAVDEEANA